MDTVESALEVDSGEKIPCRTGDSNPRQYCAWLFSRTLYQLSFIPAPNNIRCAMADGKQSEMRRCLTRQKLPHGVDNNYA